jgi:uncharacterized protein YndB with AHSA1/START domain
MTTPIVKVHMGIRRPPADVFKAFVDPEVTTRFWFTHSTGPLEPDAKVEWLWEMYGLSSPVVVREFEPDERLVSTGATVRRWRFALPCGRKARSSF